MTKNYTNPETIGLHAGWRKDENTNSVAVPIHQTTNSFNSMIVIMLQIFLVSQN